MLGLVRWGFGGEGAVQIHGAMGLTAELRLGGYFRRARTLAQGDGGPDTGTTN